jgi:hypothetical protein
MESAVGEFVALFMKSMAEDRGVRSDVMGCAKSILFIPLDIRMRLLLGTMGIGVVRGLLIVRCLR